MRDLIDQLELSLQHPFYFLSLFMALAIPDIAGALDSDDGCANGKRYVRWYDQWARPQFGVLLKQTLPPEAAAHLDDVQSPMTGEECYRFRCSLLHQGKTHDSRSPHKRIIFVEPGATPHMLHGNVSNGALNIDVRLFCLEIIRGTREWLDVVEGAPRFNENYSAFVRRYPDGLPPYIGGLPVVG